MTTKSPAIPIFTFALIAALAGCATAPRTEARRDELKDDAAAALSHLKAEDPSLSRFLTHAHGYVVFSEAGQGEAGNGAASAAAPPA